MDNCVIGFDCGGTRTRACIADLGGHIIGKGSGGPANYRHVGIEATRSSIVKAMGEALNSANTALDSIKTAVLGLAGAVTHEDLTQIHAALGGVLDAQTQTHVTHDLRIALLAATRGEPGIVAIAGTGSACYGFNAQGREARLRNDDIGSGYWLAHQSIKRSASCSKKTALSIALQNDFGQTPPSERDKLARFTPALFELRRSGDQLSRDIVDDGAAGIADLICQAANTLEIDQPTIVLAGGVLENNATYRAEVATHIQRGLPKFNISDKPADPVHGAIWIATRLAHGLPVN